jgi:SAM-dependent methyltransferase
VKWDEAAQAATSWEAAQWGSEGSQRTRFNYALALADPDPGEVLLDWGCGTGRLVEFIVGWGVRYTGVDTNLAMVERARREYAEPDGREFLHLNSPRALKATRPDVTLCLGTWNLNDDALSMPYDLLTLWEKTSRVLVASFRPTSEYDGVHARITPGEILALAEMCEAPVWELHHWKQNDIMLILRRDSR